MLVVTLNVNINIYYLTIKNRKRFLENSCVYKYHSIHTRLLYISLSLFGLMLWPRVPGI